MDRSARRKSTAKLYPSISNDSIEGDNAVNEHFDQRRHALDPFLSQKRPAFTFDEAQCALARLVIH